MENKAYTFLRYTLFLSIALLCQQAVAQEDMSDQYGHLSFSELQDLVFGKLNPENYPTGILYNRSSQRSSLTLLDGESQRIPLSMEAWFAVYEDLLEASTERSQAKLPALDNEFYHELVKYQYQDVNPREDIMISPIGIMAFDFHQFKPDALERGLIQIENDIQFVEPRTARESPFEQKRLFAAAPLIGAVEAEKIRFVYDPAYFFSNLAEAPENIMLRMREEEEWHELGPGGFVDIDADEKDGIQLEIRITIGGYVLTGIGITGGNINFTFEESDRLRVDEIWNIEADRPIAVEGYGPTAGAEVGIIYGCDDEKLRKPFILLTGYDPFREVSIVTRRKLENKLNSYNNSGFVDHLVAKGYDVIFVIYRFGADHMVNNSAVLEEIIRRVNNEKQANDSYVENLVFGMSSGALVASYTLSRMEQEYFQGDLSQNHHTKAYFSSDGEHEGANIPLGTQHAMYGFLQNRIDLPTPTEFLLYHYSQSGTPGNTGQAAHPFRGDMIAEIANTNHQHTTHAGYPSQTRNVAVTMGSTDQTPFNIQGGQLLFSRSQSLLGFVRNEAYWAVDQNSTFYRNQLLFCGLPPCFTVTNEEFQSNGAALEYEGVPGSTFNFHQLVAGLKSLIAFPSFTFVNEPDCFVPSVSAMGLDGFTNSQFQMNFDIAANMFFTAPGVQDPFYGYTHHAFQNPQNITPFHAVGGNPNNDRHHMGSIDQDILDFLESEFMSDDLLLQNRIIGEDHTSYQADFVANQTIRAGKLLSHMTQQEDFVVANNADVRMLAVESITFEPGFQAEAGATLLARIGDLCDSNALEERRARSANSHVENGSTTIAEIKEIPQESLYINISPNPMLSDGTISFNLPEEGSISILIRDIQGSVVKEIIQEKAYTKGQHQVKLSKLGLSSGLYICELRHEQGISTSKMLIK